MKPRLQPITGSSFLLHLFNAEDGASLAIAENKFWRGNYERTFLNVKVFNLYAPSNHSTNLKGIYRKHESAKKHSYEARIHNVEHGSFTSFFYLQLEEWPMNLVLSMYVWLQLTVKN